MNNKKTVLVIEDESDLRNLLIEKLTKEGFNALEAEDGKIGLEIALNQHPDIILLDLIMPVMDGITMLKELREDVSVKNIPVIILSNLNETEKVSEGMEENVYDYLVKADWDPDSIVGLIKKKLGLD